MLVSIIIPCYNVEAYLAEALESALAQDYPHIEIICVDNNSTDDTRAILENYALCYSDKINFLSEPKQGASAARNMGWRFSTGQWIQFLDADDLLLPDKISRQISLIQKGVDFIIGTPTYEDLQGHQISLIPWDDHWKGLTHGMYCGQTSANFYSIKCLKSVNGWNEELPDTQDTELMFRLLAADHNALIDSNSSCICRDRVSGKITQKAPPGTLERHLYLRQRINSFLEKNQAAYWKNNQTFFRLAIYRLLRMLAVHSVVKSDNLFKELLPKDFKVEANKQLKIPAWNAFLVNTFGFKTVENLKNNIKQFFPTSLWLFLKKLIRGY